MEVCAGPGDMIAAAESYLASRTGCYAYRCERYDAALEAMHGLGLEDGHTVVDVGAGMGEFGTRLHTGRACPEYVCADVRGCAHSIGDSQARYVPVDAAIDGTNLEHWRPPRDFEWFVCLEVLEHLSNPARLLTQLITHASRGVIVTTPNPQTTDVLGMDATHRTPISQAFLELAGMHVEEASFYGKPADSLFAVWSPRFL